MTQRERGRDRGERKIEEGRRDGDGERRTEKER